jgi:hypothetical protein
MLGPCSSVGQIILLIIQNIRLVIVLWLYRISGELSCCGYTEHQVSYHAVVIQKTRLAIAHWFYRTSG